MQTNKQRSRDEYAVTPVTPEVSPVGVERAGRSYDDHLTLAGQVADRFAQSDASAPTSGAPTSSGLRKNSSTMLRPGEA